VILRFVKKVVKNPNKVASRLFILELYFNWNLVKVQISFDM